MKNQSKNLNAQSLVNKIIEDNDTTKVEELTSNLNTDKKKNIIQSIRALDMSPLSTPVACG